MARYNMHQITVADRGYLLDNHYHEYPAQHIFERNLIATLTVFLPSVI